MKNKIIKIYLKHIVIYLLIFLICNSIYSKDYSNLKKEYSLITWKPKLDLPPASDSINLCDNTYLLNYRYSTLDSSNLIIYIEKITGLNSLTSIDDCIETKGSVDGFVSSICITFLSKFSILPSPKKDGDSTTITIIMESCWHKDKPQLICNFQLLEGCSSSGLYQMNGSITNENMVVKIALRRSHCHNDNCNNEYDKNSFDCFAIWK